MTDAADRLQITTATACSIYVQRIACFAPTTVRRAETAAAWSVDNVRDVQFSPDLRDEVAAGRVEVSVRLWQRPHVRVGGRYPVAGAGAFIEVTSVELLPFFAITPADVDRCGELNREALRARTAHAGPVHDDTLVYRIEFHVVPSPGASARN